ncbi:MAG: hypothetical protein LKE46_16650 [Clostridium sp.]|jgi:PTS system galactitol-specific IIB component|uniref:hypothetical protein n=1 Tax=Clostridium sp. TaxID=1506 RepID=UPI0025C42484|nr:hypothetical protein [Clostridium sp.]MCH3965845.1 hypothetical protein [Clostridium sp.]MCI1716066.1 hypothetical protein [Clostridium sp.]MCI1800262.1 hypothetical protein [Clostridium sp.]MCI1814243.1 hypothetical protein [Clostridium sp.]MCI1871142.1 hypothetical protein [Clostridium sp.]
MSKKIVVATGTSQHKMEFAVNYIMEYCKKKGLDVEVEGVNVYKADIQALDPSVVVLIGPNSSRIDKPVVMGTAFVTKIGMEKTCEDIIKYLK